VANRVGASIAVLAALILALSFSSSATGAASGPPADCSASPATHTSGSAFSATETLCRWFADTGQLAEAPRQFSVNVSNTSELRNRQVVTVSWTGAHPTGGIVSDEQSAAAIFQEYPVMLMECRGTGAAVSPESCWTATPNERMMATPTNPPLWSVDYDNADPSTGCASPPTGSPWVPCQAPDVNVPSNAGVGCYRNGAYQYWVPFVAADRTDYDIGPYGCYGNLPPEMTNPIGGQQELAIVPSDTTYAETANDANGSGTTNFTIETAETNASLGCSSTVACSLVIEPINGLSCTSNPNEGGPSADCESLGDFRPGQLAGTGNPAPAVTADFWWSGSNWDRRIQVPLTFAIPSNVCAQSSSPPVFIYGSESLTQATQQWNPHFCLNSNLFNVNHVQTAEPEAKNLLAESAIQGAFQGSPPAVPLGRKSFFSTPTVQAPLTLSGFAIVYVIDNSGGQPYTGLRLDPRLLAKLMTESYPGTPNVGAGDTAISRNPISIFVDPEFEALNPGFTLPTYPLSPQTAPAATLFSIFSQSDVLSALTSYVNADPEARAWLNGQPDPWGMVVNPAYKDIKLPVASWPLLDKSTSGPDYDPSINACLGNAPAGARVPDRPLIDNPEATLGQVAYNMQFSIAVSQIVCNYNQNDGLYSLGQLGPETVGIRFMVGVVSLADAYEFGLPAAELQTYVGPGAPAKFTDGSDRVFQAPDTASLTAAAALLQPDKAVGSWVLPYSDFPTDPAAIDAYPGTMLMSMDVPTEGLTMSTAKDLAEYMSYASTAGESPGAGIGQLPGGYLPMTSANGLADEVAYTKAAAADVEAQNGAVPPLVPVPTQPGGGGSPTTTTPTTEATTPTTHPAGGGQTTGGQTTGGQTTGGQTTGGQTTGGQTTGGQTTGGSHPSQTSLPSGTPKSSGPGAVAIEPAAQVEHTVAVTAGIGGLALPLALLVLIAGGGAIAVMWWLRRRPAGP
jgi:hypothetical protein